MDRHEKALKLLHEGTVIPAIPLVLNSERKLDEGGQRRLIRYYLEAGAGGMAVAVHTTQFEIRSPEYNLLCPVLTIAAEEMNAYEASSGRTLVKVAGVCGESSQSCREAALAKKLGFDAVLLSPGGLNHKSEREMLLRTRQAADILPVIGFYLQESVGGRRFSFDYWKQLADIPGVAAIKSAPFDRYRTLDLVRGCAFSDRRDEVALYTGNDDNIVIDLLTRYEFNVNGQKVTKQFAGGLLGHWSVWTKTAVELFDSLKACRDSNSIPTAFLTLAQQVTDCNGAFFDVAGGFKGCIAGIHEVLRRQGLIDGIWCLNPAETLSPGQSGEIDRVFHMYPHLDDTAFVREYLAKL